MERDSATGSPVTWSRTSSPAARTSPAKVGRSSSPGPGVNSTSSPPCRIAPSNRRISASAVRPARSTLLSASASSDPGGTRRRTAPTWSTITLIACATTSCSSRAIRARSSATATRAADSRSRSARSARSSAASLRSTRSRKAKPASQAPANSAGVKGRSAAVSVGSWTTTTPTPTSVSTRPTRAWNPFRRLPNSAAATMPHRNTPPWVVISRWSRKLNPAQPTQRIVGARKGNRLRASRARRTPVIATTSSHSPRPSGRSASSRSSVPTTVAAAAATTRTSMPQVAKIRLTRPIGSTYGRCSAPRVLQR